MEKISDLKRGTEIAIGVLYLLAMAFSIAGFSLIDSVTASPDYLSNIYPQKMKVGLGIIFQLINDGAVVGIGVLLFGFLKRYSENIATGILSTRILEGVILAIGKLSLLLLLTISKVYISSGATTDSQLSTLGTLAIKWNAWSFEFAMIALGIGGLVLCYFLYKAKLVPRLISVLGIIGYVLLFSRSILSILGYPQGFELFLPVALFEFIFPVWIIVKGFNAAQASAH